MSNSFVSLFSPAQYHHIPWPATADGDYARRTLGPLLRDGPPAYIDNADIELRLAWSGDVVLPLTPGNPHPRAINSYVCSPTTHYVDYAQREVELELSDRPLLRRLFPALLESFRPLLRRGHFEEALLVNNWLLSTNLYPLLEPVTLAALRESLVAAFPQRAIVFRSVNTLLGAELGTRLRALDFYPVFSRQVYLLDPRDRSFRRKKSFQKDRALARRSPYHWEAGSSVTPAEAPRLLELYRQLYIEKYSPYNPQFNLRFVETALEQGWLNFFVLRQGRRIDAVLGFVERAGVMTAPFIGYERSLPAESGLYRLISLKLAEEASERGLILNQSSGAAAFKRHRGSIPAGEFNYVYDRHLPPQRRLPWRLLHTLSGSLITPLMRSMEL